MPIAVPEYRERLEEMTAEALEEYYAHSAGHKRTYEIAEVYERHADLSTLEQAQALADEGAPVELRRFAAEAYIGNGVKHLSEDIANTEASLTVAFDGEDVPYREVRPRLMNEPDPARRRDLHARRCAVTEEHLNPHVRGGRRARAGAHRRPGRGDGARALRDVRLRPARRRPRHRGVHGRDRRALPRADRRGPAQAGRRRRSTMRPSPTSHGCGARRSSTQASPPSAPCRHFARRSRGWGSTSTPSGTSSSTSRPGRASARVRSARRSACPAASSSSSCRRAARTTTRPSSTRRATPSTSPSPTRDFRPSSGSSATTPSPRASPSCSSICCRIRRGSTHSSTSGRSRSTSASRRSRSSSSCAAMPASWRTRSSSTPGRRSTPCPTATPSGSRLRSVSSTRAGTISRTSTAASTAPATCAPGRSRRSCATT